ncbi:hypothetical protein P3596_23915, partial [Vibrio parahaemolyticus]|nr:hypothetical protein [Vibrio parahaemolyticus]
NRERPSVVHAGIVSVCVLTRVITGGGEKEEATLDNTPRSKPCHLDMVVYWEMLMYPLRDHLNGADRVLAPV